MQQRCTTEPAMKSILPTWKTSFSPILAEEDGSHIRIARSYSTTDSGDIISLPAEPCLSTSPTSIAAVAPPPSPGRKVKRKERIQKTNAIRNPSPARWSILPSDAQQLPSKTSTKLEQQLFHLPSDSRRVIVEGKSVLWTGKLEQGLPTGSGKMFFPDGQVYSGTCRNGLRHGPGHNTWTHQQQTFEGEWRDGRRFQGTHTWSDGRTCTAERWSDGHTQGRVLFVWPSGAKFKGWTVGGQQHGQGEHQWENGRVYKGEYWQGRQHGEGRLTEPDGVTEYVGDFREGARHGQGKQVWPTKTYEGEWNENKIHGRGTLRWNFSNKEYSGQFANGRFHGHGSYRDEVEGYIGQWVGGLQEGVGKQFFTDGTVYEGGFVKGHRQGFGCLALPDGSVYSGSFASGKRNGRGIQIAGDGDLFHCGYWKDDLPDHSVPMVDLDTISEGDLSDSSASSAETSLFSRPSDFESIFWGQR